MKIFSAASVVFPDIKPASLSPPAIISGVGDDKASLPFEGFVEFAKGKQSDSLTKAMYESFLSLIVDNLGKLDPGKMLNQIIIDTYQSIEASGDVYKLYRFHLYLYVSLYFFAARECKRIRNEVQDVTILPKDIRDYVQAELSSRYYTGGISIDPSFFGKDYFKDAFTIDGQLIQMVGDDRLGKLKEPGGGSGFKYLRGPGSKNKAIDNKAAKLARTEIVQDFRSTISKLIDTEIKKFLVKLAAGGSATGDLLLRGYGQFRQFAVGNGGTTVAMFGETDYGLLFLDYELVDIDATELSGNLCKAVIGGDDGKSPKVDLLDRRDEVGTSICFLYYGLNAPFTSGPISPKIVLHPYRDGVDLGKSGDYVLEALGASPNSHKPSGMENLGDAIQLDNFLEPPSELKCDLKSDSSSDPEEMIYVVFKHKIVHPRRQPSSTQVSSIVLKCEWTLSDNQFRKTPADIQSQIFAGQAPELASLVAALAADQSFEVYASIEGRGIGRKLNAALPGTSGLLLERDSDQRDKPPGAGYGDLRYAHGRLHWYSDPSGSGGWLIFYVAGFVSPLRCTWEDSLQPAQELEDNIEPYVTKDSSGRPSYNCVLSSFRALSLFEAMIERILFEAFNSNSVDTAAYNRISTTLNTYLDNEARVSVLLPTNRLMTKKTLLAGQQVEEVIWLKRASVDQFH
jgi:hypothetical protein